MEIAFSLFAGYIFSGASGNARKLRGRGGRLISFLVRTLLDGIQMQDREVRSQPPLLQW